MRESELGRRAESALGLPIRFALARRPFPAGGLSAGESRRYARLGDAARREDWLRGRAALKRLLEDLEAHADTARLEFPHPRYSLTHSGGLAVAVALPAGPETGSPGRPAGLGVDLEMHRPMRAGAARFYLGAAERDFAGGEEKTLLRLWTVKEALFKADPANSDPARGGPTHLWNYVLAEPGAWAGRARVCGRRVDFSYLSLELAEGFLAVAVTFDDDVTCGIDVSSTQGVVS